MDGDRCLGVLALNLEDGTLHRIKANNTIIATGYVNLYCCCGVQFHIPWWW